MSKTHNIKVNFDITAINYFCPLCVYATKSMAELKNHLVSDHNKEKHDCMVQEIKEEFPVLNVSLNSQGGHCW